ncbi:MAG: hypothetical protein ABI693_06725 [Bryobacteraceae bacterium]
MRWLALIILSAACRLAQGQQTVVCTHCHPTEAREHAATLMARTLVKGEAAPLLQPGLSVRMGDYTYRLAGNSYTVSGGGITMTGRIAWAVGEGDAGQTYVVEREGRLYESRVTYFARGQGLGNTIGHPVGPPANPEEAFGRVLAPLAVIECFSCHSSPRPEKAPDGVTRGSLAWTQTLLPGVQCESCHKGAWQHAEARKSGDMAHGRLPRLKKATAEEISEVCGVCHRTWNQIQMKGPRGILNVRFQPYRIAHSKCYDALDGRIACTACHDPHKRTEPAAAVTDKACGACHAVGTCKVGHANCASCHMPKYEIPGSQFRFTDHFIRVVKANEPYPD